VPTVPRENVCNGVPCGSLELAEYTTGNSHTTNHGRLECVGVRDTSCKSTVELEMEGGRKEDMVAC
jgi:hypothetical protein